MYVIVFEFNELTDPLPEKDQSLKPYPFAGSGEIPSNDATLLNYGQISPNMWEFSKRSGYVTVGCGSNTATFNIQISGGSGYSYQNVRYGLDSGHSSNDLSLPTTFSSITELTSSVSYGGFTGNVANLQDISYDIFVNRENV